MDDFFERFRSVFRNTVAVIQGCSTSATRKTTDLRGENDSLEPAKKLAFNYWSLTVFDLPNPGFFTISQYFIMTDNSFIPE